MSTATKDDGVAELLKIQPAWAQAPEDEDRAQKPSRHHRDDAHPLLDPYKGYTVTTYNPKYAGTVYGVEFAGGKARVEALDGEVATDEEIQMRRNFLHYIFNARQAVKPQLELDPASNKYVRTGETRHPTFRVEPL